MNVNWMENTLWCMLCTTTFIKNHLYSGTLSNTTPHFHMDGLPYASIRFVIIICTYTHKMKLLTENKIKKKLIIFWSCWMLWNYQLRSDYSLVQSCLVTCFSIDFLNLFLKKCVCVVINFFFIIIIRKTNKSPTWRDWEV